MNSYASSFKNTLQKRFASETILPRPITDDQYKNYTMVMRYKKIKEYNEKKQPVFCRYEAATDEDIMALTAVTY